MKIKQNLFVLIFFCSGKILFAQNTPPWVLHQKIENQSDYYSGIGLSQISIEDADLRAFITFSHSVEVKVKSIFQREVSEEGEYFSDRSKISSQTVSDMSLKGIVISERYIDTTSKTFYSLIRYRKTEYDSMVTLGIQREISLMQTRNRMEEERRQEEIRAEKAKNALEEDRKKEELRVRKSEIEIQRIKLEQEEEEKNLYLKLYDEFLEKATPLKVVTLRNGEISHHTFTVMVKGGISPLRMNGGFFAMRLAMFEFSGNAIFSSGKFNQQEGFAKIQILPGVGEYTKTSLAIGMSQAVAMIADSSYDFKRSKYSFFISGNYTNPEWEYSTISFFGDKRKLSLGGTIFPFYSQLKSHLGFVIESNVYFDNDFRNKYDNSVVVNGGIVLQANENFSTQFTYENNEQFNLTFEFQF